jgi:hypothetical protein
MSNPLRELTKYGQSVWYDYIRRALIESGDLKKLIDEDGLSSVTSNPSIFEKAIAGSTDYDRELRATRQSERPERESGVRATGDPRHPGSRGSVSANSRPPLECPRNARRLSSPAQGSIARWVSQLYARAEPRSLMVQTVMYTVSCLDTVMQTLSGLSNRKRGHNGYFPRYV